MFTTAPLPAVLAICGTAAQRNKVGGVPAVVIDDGGLAQLASDDNDAEIDRRLAAICQGDPSIDAAGPALVQSQGHSGTDHRDVHLIAWDEAEVVSPRMGLDRR